MSQQDNQQPPTAPPWAQAMSEPEAAQPWWRSPKTVAPLALLVLLLAIVIFWLPTQIATPQVASTSAYPSLQAKPQTTLESPWSDAQLAKQRREAQDILARLLDKQESLENAAVDQWAEEQFRSAINAAASGDEFYRQREFDPAKQQYISAEQAMDKLLAQKQQVFAQSLQQGLAAIETNDPDAALAALNIAAAIDPAHVETKTALNRAEVLADVIRLVKASDQAIALENLTEAKTKLDQAKGLDPNSGYINDKLSTLADLKTGRSFNDLMSNGFVAMQKKDYQSAISAFKSAQSLKPNAGDARAALTQARNAASQRKINSHISRAQQHAAQEQWKQAVEQYDSALQEDPSLVSTKIDRIKAEARLELDTNIKKLLASPLRLSDSKVFSAAQQTLADARSIAPPGSRLDQQAGELAQAMELAQTPVNITIKSDNQTKVTLYRVGQLGEFEQQSVALKPGQYVLVGSRAGFRDVRKEFTVFAKQKQPTIRIECTEPVANG